MKNEVSLNTCDKLEYVTIDRPNVIYSISF